MRWSGRHEGCKSYYLVWEAKERRLHPSINALNITYSAYCSAKGASLYGGMQWRLQQAARRWTQIPQLGCMAIGIVQTQWDTTEADITMKIYKNMSCDQNVRSAWCAAELWESKLWNYEKINSLCLELVSPWVRLVENRVAPISGIKGLDSGGGPAAPPHSIIYTNPNFFFITFFRGFSAKLKERFTSAKCIVHWGDRVKCAGLK